MPFVLIPNCSKNSSVVVLNKHVFPVLKRFYPGNNLAKALFKGVSGSFTMHDKLCEELLRKKGVLAYHLLHHISNLPKTNLNNVQELYDNISNIVLSTDSLCKDPKIQPFGKILNHVPFSFVYPWNQNFLSQQTYKQYYPIENVAFSYGNELPIDATAYSKTGMTVQNFLEYKLLKNVFKGLYNTYIQENKKDNIKFKLINPLLQQGKTFTYNVSKIQTNPDAVAQMYIVQNGVEQPPKDIIIKQQKNTYLDLKIIQSPENNLPPLLGNISVTSSNDFLIYLDRLIGTLHVYHNKKSPKDKFITKIIDDLQEFKKNIKKEISAEISKTEKELNKLNVKYYTKEITENITDKILKKNVDKFYKMLYQIHCNPHIKDVFPGIIYFNTYNETNNLSQESDQVFSYLEKVTQDENALVNYNTIPQNYFVAMGHEDDEIYRNNIHKFLSAIPKGSLQNSLIEKYELFIKSLESLSNQHITWGK